MARRQWDRTDIEAEAEGKALNRHAIDQANLPATIRGKRYAQRSREQRNATHRAEVRILKRHTKDSE